MFCRLKGSMTIEAAYIFPFCIILIMLFILLDFELFDNLLSDSCLIMGELRYDECKNFHYNCEDQEIDVAAVVSSPVVGTDKKFINSQRTEIVDNMKDYYNARRIGNSSLESSDVSEGTHSLNIAELIRAGGRAVKILGGD